MARHSARFAAGQRYTGVILQQGRVRLDGDSRADPGGWPARIRASVGPSLSIRPGPAPVEYANTRRLTEQIENSLYRGLAWSTFEPNGPTLWAQLRLAATSDLMGFYRNGALMGATPDQAFFVRCDTTTMTQFDIDNGRVNLIVGIAPIYPAEFVLLVIGLMAGS